MARPKKTLRNPHQLTAKQKLVIEDIVEDVSQGKGIRPSRSHAKIYNAKDQRNAEVLASQNLSKTNFQDGLIEALRKRNILGVNGKLQQRLAEGLDATDTDQNPEYRTRLSYIQEINKITGVYAPVKIDQRSLSLRANVTPEQIDEKIDRLQEELNTS